MTTITIPQNLIKEKDLVVIPRRKYEKLLGDLKRYTGIDRDLNTALEEVKQKKTIGPFNSVKELKKSLEKRKLNIR